MSLTHQSDAPTYRCPGETYTISHSVHLARLASFYAKCANCPHRGETGSAPHSNAMMAASTSHDAAARPRFGSETRSLLTAEGVRGVYLNELDRTKSVQWGAALGRMLQEFASRSNQEVPTVVIGFDERPSAPDIVTGAADGLRRSGCRVVDLGQTIPSCWRFSVRNLACDAGLFVTGAGCDPAWIGFDVIGRDAVIWTGNGLLEQLELRVNSLNSRSNRAFGRQTQVEGFASYVASLGESFHAIRPLHLACGSSSRLFTRVVDQLFQRLPCRVTHVALPVRRRDFSSETDPDFQRVADVVTSNGLHLGLIADEDGQHCRFVTEHGHAVSPAELACLLIDMNRHEFRRTDVGVTKRLHPELDSWLNHYGVVCDSSHESPTQLALSLSGSPAKLGFDENGRVWFNETVPTCDVFLTLARMLQALSLSDAPLSEVIRKKAGLLKSGTSLPA